MERRQGEDLCALCSQQSGGCCRTDPACAHLSFPLSPAEWRRVAPYAYLAYSEWLPAREGAERKPDVGRAVQNRPPLPPLATSVLPPKNGDAVCITERNDKEFLQAACALFPGEAAVVERLFPAKGTHLRLRTLENGSCVFQGRDGCRLPRQVRPWYCVLFPGWIQRNSLTLFLADNCLAAARAKSPEQGLRRLGVGPEEIFAVYGALRKDWGF